jgi:hypothetical protein
VNVSLKGQMIEHSSGFVGSVLTAGGAPSVGKQLWIMHRWAWLYSNKTLFTKRSGEPDLTCRCGQI